MYHLADILHQHSVEAGQVSAQLAWPGPAPLGLQAVYPVLGRRPRHQLQELAHVAALLVQPRVNELHRVLLSLVPEARHDIETKLAK